MLSSTPKAVLAASCFFFLLNSLSAAPVEEVVKVLQVRQDLGDGDDDGGAITDAIRNAYLYSQVFLSSTPTWYTILSYSTNSGTYQPYTVGTPKPTPPPAAQTGGQGTSFNVDHVLELQAVASFVQSSNPNPAAIPDASWNSLRQVVTQTSPSRLPAVTPIAVALGQPPNLGGIPSNPNYSKQQYFALAFGAGGIAQNVAPYIIDANRRYLIDRQGGIVSSVIPNVGVALGAAGGGSIQDPVGQAISTAWVDYVNPRYNAVITALGGF